MDTKMLLTALIALVIGIGGGYAVAATRAPDAGEHMMSNGSRMSQNIDQHFIVQMIPHHEGAIAMAKIALARSERPEVLSLANGIIEAQEKENRDMRSWYQSWFGSAPPEGGMGMMRPSDEQGSTEASRPNVHMGGMEGDTAALASVSDAEFDREFLEQMIPHHEMAIMMAQMLQASTERDEMKTLADNILTSQAREIDMMRGWQKAWYGQ